MFKGRKSYWQVEASLIIHSQLDKAAIAVARAEGRAMTLEQAIAYWSMGADFAAIPFKKARTLPEG